MDSETRVLIDLRDRTLQKNRIAFGNRMNAIQEGKDETTAKQSKILEKWYKIFFDLEKELDKDIPEMIEGIEIVYRLKDIKGIGDIYAAELISMIDISRSDSVSQLWRYAGLAVIDGEKEHNKKGERSHYNSRLKSCLLYKIGGNFLKNKSPYAALYYDGIEYYKVKHPEWTEFHQKNAAKRKMLKVFLSHLWFVWRSIEGLPTRNLYVEEYMGHTHILPPQQFGWKDWQ